MSQAINITSPVGRYVQGSLYKAETTNAKGEPLVYKKGADAGKPRVNYFFAIAIPKNPGETHWSQAKEVLQNGSINDWGAKIWQVGHAAHPGPAQSPTFAWKIEDGDSTIPNKKGKKPCDREGFPGNWILRLSGGFAPKIYRRDGNNWINEVTENFVQPGDYIQVSFDVEGNGNDAETPGVYLNHRLVAFSAYGPRIDFGPDVESCGFGQSQLPAGASAVPLASTVPPPVDNGFSSPPPPPTPTVPVTPNLNFGSIQVPAIPTPPPAKQMTPAAEGISYEDYIKAGWSDKMLIDTGRMLP